MSSRPNILVVCGRNKRRSRTAEYMFKNDQRLSIRSVGLSPKSERQINVRDITWSSSILVMEQRQKTRILQSFRHLPLPPIKVLDIRDDYEYLDPELMEMLTEKINALLKTEWNID